MSRKAELRVALVLSAVMYHTLSSASQDETARTLAVVLPPPIEFVTERNLLLIGDYSSPKQFYAAVAAREARARGIPPAVAVAVIHTESRFVPTRVGRVGEIGLMQVRPKTAAFLGFSGEPGKLFDPETNIRYGVMYLAKAWSLADGQLCRALMKYRAGHASKRMSKLSLKYCQIARVHMAEAMKR